jgi:hypothetical protein
MRPELIKKLLDLLFEEDYEAVIEWIHHKFPHGIGLYD